MAKRYFVRRSPQKRKSSTVPLLFEKVIWGLIAMIALILVLSLLWRHGRQNRAPDMAELQHKIIRQIPRAQLEFAEQQLSSRQDQQALVVSLEAQAQAPPQPDSGTAGSSGDRSAAASRQGAPSAEETGINQPEPANLSPGSLDSHLAPRAAQSGAVADQAKAPPAHAASPVAKQAPYIVRVGAFKSRANVEVISARIEKLGYKTQSWELNHARLGHLIMLELAPFEKKEDAEKAKAEVEKQERLKAQLMVKQ